jgi:hypothetical protein
MIQFITVANQSSSLDATCKDFERSKDRIFSTKYVSITLHRRCKPFIKKNFKKASHKLCNFSYEQQSNIRIFIIIIIIIIFSDSAAQRGLWPPRPRAFLITQNNAPQSLALLWTSDQFVAETSTAETRWDLNSRSQ